MTNLLTDAEAFLTPVLHRGKTSPISLFTKAKYMADAIFKSRGKSVLERIALGNPDMLQDCVNPRVAVIRKALALLLNIHYQLEESPKPALRGEILYNSRSRRIVDALLDLISLEGIYPALLPGVGVPIQRRVKSVLRNGTLSRVATEPEGQLEHDSELLLYIVAKLDILAASNGKGLYNAFMERTIVDLIAAQGQLAYSPNADQFHLSHVVALQALLDEYVSLLVKETFRL